MNLEELRSEWQNSSHQSEQKLLSEADIKDVIAKRNKKYKIKSFIPEAIFILSYLYLAFFLLMFNSHFENLIYRVLVFSSIIILICQSGLIYSTVKLFNKKLLLTDSYKASIDNMMAECKKLNRRYILILGFSLAIFMSCVILIPKVYSENLSRNQILVTYSLGIIALGYLKLKMYRYYKRLIENNNSFKKSLGVYKS